jgi:hypothetical protein
VVLPGWVNNFALSFPRLPQPEIDPSEQEKKKKKIKFNGGNSPTQPPPYDLGVNESMSL